MSAAETARSHSQRHVAGHVAQKNDFGIISDRANSLLDVIATSAALEFGNVIGPAIRLAGDPDPAICCKESADCLLEPSLFFCLRHDPAEVVVFNACGRPIALRIAPFDLVAGGDDSFASTRIFIGKLGTVTKQELFRECSSYGNILDFLMKDQ